MRGSVPLATRSPVALENAVGEGSYEVLGDGEKRIEIPIARTDLNGVAKAGRAEWRLASVEQPETTLPPAEIPRQLSPGEEERFRTPGDRLRPRWNVDYSLEAELARWPDGEVVRRGAVEHGDDGSALVVLDDLTPGAYRLHYSTTDEFGSLFETRRDLLVAGDGLRLEVPALLLAERETSKVGETLKVLVHSGLKHQELLIELQSGGETVEQRRLQSGAGPVVLDFPVDGSRRGGFGLLLTTLIDFQFISLSQSIWVPWEDRELQLAFSSFRDLLRPGGRETWRVTVASPEGQQLERGAAEVLAYMYDRSLDLFAPHDPPSIPSLYPTRTGTSGFQTSLGSSGAIWQKSPGFVRIPGYPQLHGDQIRLLGGYGIGGPGRREGFYLADAAPAAQRESDAVERSSLEESKAREPESVAGEVGGAAESPAEPVELRSEFAETAFWQPHLVVEEEGVVSFEFTVPDSVTEWNVWLHALDRDFRGGSTERRVRTVKELMVRPYLPRFLREGDTVDLAVVVNNAGDTALEGQLDFEILDPADDSILNAEFGLESGATRAVPFSVMAGAGTSLLFPVTVPPRVGLMSSKTAETRVHRWRSDPSVTTYGPVPSRKSETPEIAY